MKKIVDAKIRAQLEADGEISPEESSENKQMPLEEEEEYYDEEEYGAEEAK